GKRGMRLSEIVVERERSVRGGPRLRKGVLGRQHPVLPIARKRVGISKPRVRLRIGRIGLDRLVEGGDRLAQALLGALVPEEPAFEIGLVSRGIDTLAALEMRLLASAQGRANLLGDVARDPVLQPDRVAKILLVALRPNALVGRRL